MTTTQPISPSPRGPDCAPRLLRRTRRRGLAEYRRPADTGRSIDPDALLDQVDLSGLLGRGGAAFPLAVEAAHRPRQRPPRQAARWWSPTAKRANPRRSRTAGCCATGRTWCSTGCGWRRRSSARAARMCTSPTRSRPLRCDSCARRDSTRSLRRTDDHGADGRARLRRGRGDRCGAAHQRRTRQTDRQAAPAVRGRRCRGSRRWSAMSRRWPDLPYIHRHGSQRRSAQQGTSTSPGTFLATITGGGQATGALRDPARRCVSPNCSTSTGCRPIGARRPDGRLLRRPAQHATSSTHARPRDDAPARQRAGLRRDHRSSPRTARSPSRRR